MLTNFVAFALRHAVFWLLLMSVLLLLLLPAAAATTAAVQFDTYDALMYLFVVVCLFGSCWLCVVLGNKMSFVGCSWGAQSLQPTTVNSSKKDFGQQKAV